MSFIINSYVFDSGVPIPTGNLVIYMRLDNSAADQTGNFTPSASGITYATGLYSGTAAHAAEFNASGDKFTISDDDLISFGDGTSDSPFSICFAINGDNLGVISSGNYLKTLVAKRGAGATTLEYQIDTTNDATPKIRFILFDDSSGGSIRAEGATTLSNSTTYFVTVTYDGSGSASGMTVYIDGVEDSTSTSTVGSYTAMENLTESLTLAESWQPLFRYDGRMDEFGLFDKELSADEVTAIYNKISSGNSLL